MKKWLLVLPLLLAGCSIGSFRHVGLTGCNHYSGWCNEIRALAGHSWKYAQLSSNVYRDDSGFDVSSEFKELKSFANKDKDIGFYAVLYQGISNGAPNDELVFVIRGTEGIDPKDWVHGNILAKQNAYGLKIFQAIRAEYGSDKHYVVAGHSLGGGVAMHISLHEADVKTYSFNGSPRFNAGKDVVENERYSIVEYGEILKLARAFSPEATQLYTSIGCSSGDAVKQHAQRLLAECLTQIGAIGSDGALKSLEANDLKFKYRRTDG